MNDPAYTDDTGGEKSSDGFPGKDGAAEPVFGNLGRQPYPPPVNEYLATGFALGANDGPVDDYLAMVDGWKDPSGQNLMSSVVDAIGSAKLENAASPGDMLDRIASEFSPRQMRKLGGRILKLADALDQMWDPTEVRSTYHWVTRAGRIERNSLALAQVAISTRNKARARSRFLSAELLGEPAWEMLLELFIQFAGKADVSTKSLCLASGVSDTTALRIIDKLEANCLVQRSQSEVDKRVTLVRLTRQGVVAVGSILSHYMAE